MNRITPPVRDRLVLHASPRSFAAGHDRRQADATARRDAVLDRQHKGWTAGGATIHIGGVTFEFDRAP
jgi:hypothetical protein